MPRNLVSRRAQSSVYPFDVAEIQDDIGGEDPIDQLFDVTHSHVPDEWKGQPATKMDADFLPPFEIDEPVDMPRKTEGVVIEVHTPYVAPGRGPEDLEPMIPEGELGF